MTGKDFFNKISNSSGDPLGEFLRILEESGLAYCVIGGLAVNAYVEPIVSLDIDIVIALGGEADNLINKLSAIFKIERFSHSINLSREQSDLRIQIQLDPRYVDYPSRAVKHEILGHQMLVADKADVLQGKVWAALDSTRRGSKRQKDLADIARLLESYPELQKNVPEEILKLLSF